MKRSLDAKQCRRGHVGEYVKRPNGRIVCAACSREDSRKHRGVPTEGPKRKPGPRPILCECHGVRLGLCPSRRSASHMKWAGENRAKVLAYNRQWRKTPKGQEAQARSNARKLVVCAGGLRFYYRVPAELMAEAKSILSERKAQQREEYRKEAEKWAA